LATAREKDYYSPSNKNPDVNSIFAYYMPANRHKAAARNLSHVFEADSQIGFWLQRAQEEARLKKLLKRQLPSPVMFKTRVSPSSLKLLAPSGAVAAVLKQRLPDMKRSLLEAGYEFDSVAVQVQPAKKGSKSSFSQEAAQSLSPRNPPDKKALDALLHKLPAGCPLWVAVQKLKRWC
jgi:hypothetical protein